MSLTDPQLTWAPDAQLPELLISPLSHLGLIQVTGEQNRSFIHGQITADVNALSADDWCWGAHCDPKGKMLSAFRLFAVADALMLLMPKDTVASDLPEFRKYAVFSKAELNDVAATWTILGVAGSAAADWIKGHFPAFSTDHKLIALEQGAVLNDGERFLIVLPTAVASTLVEGEALYHHSAWQALEILAGYPALSAAHQAQFVPQMCNLQALNGISFTKGCYMGQETVARMKYRGGNKRAMYILNGTADIEVTAESTLELALEDGFRPQGTIVEAVQIDGQLLLTAVLPNDTERDAKFRIAEAPQSQLSIVPLPYTLEE
ncbi:tRNA-modifying protein YgfZ [Shewanella sp. A32]|uniref:tRNA-modifying protein YgfZ n=1 Tax=Shewanella sp. A32 TaxID=3031327 RepID=UPI0023B93CB5|nr:tRNA-modifying protein YgfZ [Shewanella sp. A32]MDF0533987.1 tRNA-modifying protein YgfZ [Shewanella sp. A32]